jgi:hypothetical protein
MRAERKEQFVLFSLIFDLFNGTLCLSVNYVSMKKVLILLSLFSILPAIGTAQEQCGTEVTNENIENLEILNKLKSSPFLEGLRTSQEYHIAITPHIVRRSNGTGGLTESELREAMVDLNEAYAGSGLSFYIHENTVRFVDDDNYYDFDASQEGDLIAVNNVTSTINIYFFNSLSAGAAALCGYAYFPDTGRDWIMMANGCTVGGTTLAHEVGHYFALWHTHGKTNNGTTDELVDGSNCATAGDDICDTPADPNLFGNVGSGCGLLSSSLDPNGDTFRPDPRNVMSYSSSSCRYLFSEGQKERMLNAFLTFKTYLNRDDYRLDLELDVQSACVGDQITIQAATENIDNLLWSVPEGSTTSDLEGESIELSFDEPGIYDISVEAITGGGNPVSRGTVIYVARDEINESLQEDFEAYSFTENVVNPDGLQSWRVSTSAFDGDRSARMDFFFYNEIGNEDYLLMGAVDSRDHKFYAAKFHYAYAGFGDSFQDGLQLVVKDKCSDEWTVVWEKFGRDLRTTTNYARSRYSPSRSQWMEVRAEFEILESIDEMDVALRAINGFGNMLYVDNFELTKDDPNFRIEDASIVNNTCAGVGDGAITVTTSGVGTLRYSLDGISFQESNVFENVSDGDYTISVLNEDSGIIETFSTEVKPEALFPNKPSLNFFDGRLTANVSLFPGEELLWFLDNEPLEVDDANIEDPEPGAYQAMVTNGTCESFSETFVILSVAERLGLKVFPNPATDVLQIRTNETTPIQTHILDMAGRRIQSQFNERDIDVSALRNGLYILEIVQGEDQVQVKFLKQ